MPESRPVNRGTLALSWGPYGGFYLHRHRICLGRIALTYVPRVEIDDLMETYVDRCECSVHHAHDWRRYYERPGEAPKQICNDCGEVRA